MAAKRGGYIGTAPFLTTYLANLSNSFGHRCPSAFLGAALNRSFDKRNSLPAVFDIRILGAVATERFAGLPFAHVCFETTMQPGIGIMECLWMPWRNRRFGH